MSVTNTKKRKPINKKTRESVYALCGGHCAYCGKEITIKEMQVDHYLSHDYGDIYANGKGEIDSEDNYLPACRSCNYRKSSGHLEFFRASVSRLHSVLMRDSVTYRDAVRFEQVKPNEHVQIFYFEAIGVRIPAMEWDQEIREMYHKEKFKDGEAAQGEVKA